VNVVKSVADAVELD